MNRVAFVVPLALAGAAAGQAQIASLEIEVAGAMAPVAARVVLACKGPAGERMTYVLAFGERADFEIVRDARVSISRTFGRTTTVRGLCRDARGRAGPAMRRIVIAVDAALERDSVIVLANVERERAGRVRLRPDATLDAVATAHARDMAERGYFGHVSPDGKDLERRLKDGRVEYLLAGENIAGHESVRGAMRAWLASSRHRENLLSPDYDRIGVGVFRTPTSPYTYYVQVFAK